MRFVYAEGASSIHFFSPTCAFRLFIGRLKARASVIEDFVVAVIPAD